jgi:cytochrome P450
MVRNPVAVLERYRARHGATFSFHFGGIKPAVVTSDPVVLEHVLKTNRDNYHKSDIQVERMVEFQGKGLVNSHGEEWLRLRRVIAHGFRSNHLARLLPLQQNVVEDLLTGFNRDARRGPVDMHQQMVRFTLRLVGNSLFGRALTEPELDRIGDIISAIQEFVVRQALQPYNIPWFRLSGRSERHQTLRREGDAIVRRHIDTRIEEGGSGVDLLRILMETPYHDTGQPMGEAQMLIESNQVMVAGNETTSNALTWIFYLLGRHPQYVDVIRDEVAAVIGDAPLDYRNLHALDATMRVVDEALRLYPPFWMIDRVALADDEVACIHIPAGAMLIPYIYGTHRNPAYWDDVETFDPRRFESDRVKARHPFAYVPFGGGPRICIGSSMAIMQILMIVVTFVRRYDFSLASPEPVEIKPMMLLRPRGAVAMNFRERS